MTKPLGDTLQAAGRIRFCPTCQGNEPHITMLLSEAHSWGSVRKQVLKTLHALYWKELPLDYGLCRGSESNWCQLEHMLAIGGGTASRYWVKLLATVLGTPLYLPKSSEFGAALGAARLAICATTGVAARDIMSSPATFDCVAPEASLIETYDQAYVAFRASYPRIKDIQ